MTTNVTQESGGGAPTGPCHCLEPRLVALETKVDHMDKRLVALETKVDHMDERLKETKKSVDELRTDNRELLRWGMAATALMFGTIVSSHLLLTSKTDLITAEASKSAITMQKIADEVGAIKAISLEQQSHEAPKR